MQPILSHHLSLTSCWASPQPQRVWRNMFFQTCIQSQTCSFWHTGGCQILHDVFLQILNRHGISFLLSEELSSSLPDSFDGFCPSPSVFAFELDAGEDDRPFRLWPAPLFPEAMCHDWDFMRLLWNTVHVPSPENTLPLSSQPRLCFLFDSWWLLLFPQLRYGLWSFEFSSSDQYEVLQLSSILNYSVVHCFEQFQGRTKPKQSEAEQSPVILTWKIRPFPWACRKLIIEHDPIERRSLGRRHSANWEWTNVRVLPPLHKLRLHGNARRSCEQFLFHVRIGQNSEHAAPRHTPLRGSERARREAPPTQTQSSHQAYRSRGKSFRPTIDRDVVSSSLYFAIATFLIQCVVRWGSADFEHTSVLKLTFHLWNSTESGNSPRCNSEIGKSRKINHTTVGISSTSLIQQSTSTLEAWYKYWRSLRFLSHFTFQLVSISRNVRSQFLRRRCQILWIVEQSRESSFSSTESFKNVSWSTHKNTVYHAAFPNRGKAWFWDSEFSTVDGKTWDIPELLPDSGS